MSVRLESVDYRMIDPVALVLHGEALLRYYLQHYPDEPAIVGVERTLKATKPAEIKEIRERAAQLARFGSEIEKVAAKAVG